jgi:tetratricopeptide (TPR) repeat protein
VIKVTDLPIDLPPATAGDIAVINLESARQQSWSRFWRAPDQPGTVETIVEQEQLTTQFVGDLAAFDRLEVLVDQLVRTNPGAAQTSLIAAQVACATHRFVEARAWLTQAVARGASSDATARLSLSIDQATGENLPAILAARRERAGQPGQWEELVPLGALLADLGEFDEAERTYHRALREYRDVSPFALAWVCFELGVLWGERAPAPQVDLAARWYRTAIDYLPCYVKARVHLAEIYLRRGQTEEARALLTPVIASGDPEVFWRLAEVEEAVGNSVEAASLMRTARFGFEALLARHLLAFADHAAEFYSASGGNPARACEFAGLNLANRPTLRAFEQAWATAFAAGEVHFAAELIADASKRWGSTVAFGFSPMHIAADHGGDGRLLGSPLTTQLRERANARA